MKKSARLFAGALAVILAAATSAWAAETPRAAGSLPADTQVGKDGPADPNAFARGRGIAKDLGWSLAPGPFVGTGFQDFTHERLLNDIYGRGGLTPKERELIIIAIIVTQGSELGLTWHFDEVAHRVGINERELREVLYTTCYYAGWPKCSQAFNALGRALAKPNSTWPKEMLLPPTATPAAAKPNP